MIRMAQQCTAPTGETGSYLFIEASNIPAKLISPVFADTADLFAWIKANDWEHYHPANEPFNQYIGAYRNRQCTKEEGCKMRLRKNGIYTSVRKGEDLGFYGVVTVYEDGKKVWQEILREVHRLNRKDALADAESVKEDMLLQNRTQHITKQRC